MSAYLISSDYCILLAAWAKKPHTGVPTVEEVKATADAIWRTNVASLEGLYPKRSDSPDSDYNTRYPDMIDYTPDDIKVTDGLILDALERDLAVVYMASRCAAYQSCEFEGWEQTAGGRAIEQAGEAAAYQWAKYQSGGGWPDIQLNDSGAIRLSSLLT